MMKFLKKLFRKTKIKESISEEVISKFKCIPLEDRSHLYSYRYRMDSFYKDSENDYIIYIVADNMEDVITEIRGQMADGQFERHVSDIKLISHLIGFTDKAVEFINGGSK